MNANKVMLSATLLALAAPAAEPAAAEKRTQESALKGARILLVEDNELNQEIAKTLLEMMNS